MTIVVIGHGRSPEGKGWGSRIDSCCHVVRMWDWYGWQSVRDYGEAYHYGLFVLTPKGLNIFNKHVRTKPSRGWLAYFGKPTAGILPDRTEVLDNPRWEAVMAGMGGAGVSGRVTLTRGCAAAAWAIEQFQKLSPGSGATVILVGFDNVAARINRPVEESFNPEYWKLYMSRFAPNVEKVYPIGTAKTATHDMAVEYPFLCKLAKQHNVELKLAQEVW